MHRQRTVISVACLLILVTAAAFLVSPYVVIRKARQAAENGDTNALAHYVDYPAVHASVESALVNMVLQEMGLSEYSPSELEAAVLGVYIYPVAQHLASPSGVAAMLSGRAPDLDVPTDMPIQDKALITMRYQGLNRFAVILSDYENAPQNISLIFRRKGLSWQMTAIAFQGV